MPTFARTDFDILSGIHDVEALDFPKHRYNLLKIIAFLYNLQKGVKWADITFSWFGKLHAFFTVLFSKVIGKKSVVVVSGGEVCRFSFNHGQYKSLCTRRILRFFPRYITYNSDLLLPVSNYVYNEALQTVNANKRKMKMIHHGFDKDIIVKPSNITKRKIAITVAEIMDENLYHKRLLEFVDSANYLDEISFILIGPEKDGTFKKLKSRLPRNASMKGGLYKNDLIEQLSQATVFVQASTWESFGCAVAEAMLCECVPVVTRIPALEEVVGDCGVYLDDPVTPQEIAEKVRVALQHPELGKRARLRIIEKFHIEKRKTELLDAVNSISVK